MAEGYDFRYQGLSRFVSPAKQKKKVEIKQIKIVKIGLKEMDNGGLYFL